MSDIYKQLLGIVLPIRFSTNKLSRTQLVCDELSGRRLYTIHGIPTAGFMRLYFAPKALKRKDVERLEPGSSTLDGQSLYLRHNAYGPHDYLLPVFSETIEQPKRHRSVHFTFDQIAECPTTAATTQGLQFLPCTADTLPLLQEKLQTYPFLIRVTKEGFQLYVKDSSGVNHSWTAQDYAPRTWHGSGHDTVTLGGKNRVKPLRHFDEIEWPLLVEALTRAGVA